MAASLGQIGSVSYYLFYLMLSLELLLKCGLCEDVLCATNCTCTGNSVDCSNLDLTDIPHDLPGGTISINLSNNKLTAVNTDILSSLPNLQEVRLDYNQLTSIPSFGEASSRIVTLYLQHNKIGSIDGRKLAELTSLQTLDLSNNDITELRTHCFPAGPQIKDLYLSSNKIVHLETGAFDQLSGSLQILRLSRNRLMRIPVKAFQLPNLTQLELSRNRLRQIEGLTFQGLSRLEVLKLQRNNISNLTDGAFWGLSKMRVLHLEFNSLKEVNSGSLYGLTSLQQLYLSNNSIALVNPDGWRFCQKLRELNLSYNNLSRLDEGSLAVLGDLHTLRLGHNSISHINEGAFKGLKALRNLELDHNDISGTIEDTNGAFTGLDGLHKLTLFGNKIKSVAKKAFSGLKALQHLNLGDNAIRSIQEEAFSMMTNLQTLHIQSDSFLCDCQLQWLPAWLSGRGLTGAVSATCAHPESLKGTSVFQAPADSFVCDDLPSPKIMVNPVSTVSVLGQDVRLSCTAASSSSSQMTFAWRKDQEPLRHAEMENYAHMRGPNAPAVNANANAQPAPAASSATDDDDDDDDDGTASPVASSSSPSVASVLAQGNVMEYTTVLHLRHVTFAHEGRYQCVITNHFGSSYSQKAKLTVNVLPSFTKTPQDLTVRVGATARLECAAEGHPLPQMAWQKDGGTDFPAARERRMHLMPNDDVFFITEVKPEDAGVYSCTARNSAGAASANATLTVLETPHLAQDMEDRSVVVGDTVALQCKALGSPPPRITWIRGEEALRPGERHHFTPGNQLLVIRQAVPEDAGRYTCLMSNPLGTERAHCQLSVRPQAQGLCPISSSLPAGTIAAGIIVIAVVTSVVATSLVWVCIIYQTRKRSEECSVTNTDETIVPPDVPSYLSSQGTLSERQDGSIRVDSSSGGSQPNGHIDSNGFDHPVCSDCLENYSKPPDYLLQSPTTTTPATQQQQYPEYTQQQPPQQQQQQQQQPNHHPAGYISVPMGNPTPPGPPLPHNNHTTTTTTTVPGTGTVPVPVTVVTIPANPTPVTVLPTAVPHCNGTPNGTPNGLRHHADMQAFPSNHDRVASAKKHAESKEPSITRTGTEDFLRPVKLSPLTSVDIERHHETSDSLTQTLLSNGHGPRAILQNESSSLRRASD
ncbi:leucine-rich repeats and immunoglobulin-like domains protein 1 [Engraulis encrasicolus]|uniref:leucine-rich repeats and immunoglobulin-like domains protein 1 n=1 Tax=Engraulis encrasicolus TaxID=184585 RepID=UPI002FD2D7E8